MGAAISARTSASNAQPGLIAQPGAIVRLAYACRLALAISNATRASTATSTSIASSVPKTRIARKARIARAASARPTAAPEAKSTASPRPDSSAPARRTGRVSNSRRALPAPPVRRTRRVLSAGLGCAVLAKPDALRPDPRCNFARRTAFLSTRPSATTVRVALPGSVSPDSALPITISVRITARICAPKAARPRRSRNNARRALFATRIRALVALNCASQAKRPASIRA